MENKKIVKYKKNIFLQIKEKIMSLFQNKPKNMLEEEDNIPNREEKKSFKDLYPEIKEKERLMRLKLLYDKKQISEEDISEEDAEELVKLYEEETEKINNDSKKRLEKIEKILK